MKLLGPNACQFQGFNTAPSGPAPCTTWYAFTGKLLTHYNTERQHLSYQNQERRLIATVMSFIGQEG